MSDIDFCGRRNFQPTTHVQVDEVIKVYDQAPGPTQTVLEVVELVDPCTGCKRKEVIRKQLPTVTFTENKNLETTIKKCVPVKCVDRFEAIKTLNAMGFNVHDGSVEILNCEGKVVDLKDKPQSEILEERFEQPRPERSKCTKQHCQCREERFEEPRERPVRTQEHGVNFYDRERDNGRSNSNVSGIRAYDRAPPKSVSKQGSYVPQSNMGKSRMGYRPPEKKTCVNCK